MNKLLSVIADPKVDKQTLIETIQKLGEVIESAQFWTAIANSDEYSKDHRRRAVFQLFQRFVSPGMTLFALAQILDNPRWLADEDISLVTVLGGEISVTWTLEDTVFVLVVFPDLPDGRYANWAIYLKVSSKVSREDFIKVIRGESVTEKVKNAKVLELGLSPDDPTNVDW